MAPTTETPAGRQDSWSSFIDDMGSFASRTIMEALHRVIDSPTTPGESRITSTGTLVIGLVFAMIALVVLTILLAHRSPRRL